MKIPTRNRHWKREIEKALSSAQKRSKEESAELECLYKYSAEYVSRARSITDKAVVEEMLQAMERDVQYNWGVDPDSKLNYKFTFVSSYLYAHVTAGIIGEREIEKVMDYLNENMELFHSRYEYQ